MTDPNVLFENLNGNITDIKQMYYLCKDFINKYDNKEREEKIKQRIKYDEQFNNEKSSKNNQKLTTDDIKCYERKYKYINYQVEKTIIFYIKKIKITIIYSGDTDASGTYQLIIDNIEICDENQELKLEDLLGIINDEMDEDERCEFDTILTDNDITMKDLLQFITKIYLYL